MANRAGTGILAREARLPYSSVDCAGFDRTFPNKAPCLLGAPCHYRYLISVTIAQLIAGVNRRLGAHRADATPLPTRERVGYSDQARLSGLRQATQAAFVRIARPFTGWARDSKRLCTRYTRISPSTWASTSIARRYSLISTCSAGVWSSRESPWPRPSRAGHRRRSRPAVGSAAAAQKALRARHYAARRAARPPARSRRAARARRAARPRCGPQAARGGSEPAGDPVAKRHPFPAARLADHTHG